MAGRHASRDKGQVHTCPTQGNSHTLECGTRGEFKVQTGWSHVTDSRERHHGKWQKGLVTAQTPKPEQLESNPSCLTEELWALVTSPPRGPISASVDRGNRAHLTGCPEEYIRSHMQCG